MMMPARCLARFLSRVVCSLHTSAAWLPWPRASAHTHIHQDRLDGKPSNGTSGSQVPWPNGRAKCEEPRVAYHSRRYHTHTHTLDTLSLSSCQRAACGMQVHRPAVRKIDCSWTNFPPWMANSTEVTAVRERAPPPSICVAHVQATA